MSIVTVADSTMAPLDDATCAVTRYCPAGSGLSTEIHGAKQLRGGPGGDRPPVRVRRFVARSTTVADVQSQAVVTSTRIVTLPRSTSSP
jgi:hypothetical protein